MAGNTTQKVQIAREATAGTAITSGFTVWRGLGEMIKDDREVVVVDEMIGVSAPTTRNYTPKLAASCALAATEASFEQLPHLFEMGIKAATAAQDGAGSGYLYVYDTANTSEDTIKTYTVETGDTTAQRYMEYTHAQDITLSWDAMSALKMSASLVGRQSTNLTGGFDTSTTPTVETILGGKMSFYEDDDGTYPATTQVTGTVLSGELKINTGRTPKFVSDKNQLFFDYVYLNSKNFKIDGKIVMEHDAAGIALIADFEANTSKVLRFKFEGSAISDTTGATYTVKTLIIDLACVITDIDKLTDQDGNGVFTLTFQSGYSVTDTEHMTITVVNELTTLPG